MERTGASRILYSQIDVLRTARHDSRDRIILSVRSRDYLCEIDFR